MRTLPPCVPPVRYLSCFADAVVNQTWHSVATCRMMPKEEGGVVDKRLNVYGTKGLKIAGESSML